MTSDPHVVKRCQSADGSIWKKFLCAVKKLCLYLMWNDTYMTAKSEHNCSVNNEKKCSQRLHCTTFSFPPFSCFSFYLQSSLATKAPTNVDQMFIKDVMEVILLIGRHPGWCWTVDGWTMCFRGNKNVTHKSLSKHRGQSEMVCKRIIVTPVAL